MKVLVVVCVLIAVTFAREMATFKKAEKDGIPGRYIITLKDGVSVDGFVQSAEFSNVNARVRHTYTLIHGLSVELPSQYIDRLRNVPGIDVIYEDAICRSQQVASWGLDRTDQRGYPLDNKFSTRMTGKGVKVYVVDTGIRYTHEEFGTRAKYFWDYEPENAGNDCNGHGTHCSGTVAGTTYGIAKDAELYSARVLSCWGSGAWDDCIKALDAIAEAQTLEPNEKRIASLSLGGFAYDIVDEAVERAVKAGVVVVIAAGNSDDDACLYTPARAPSAVTVGATIYTEDSNYIPNGDERASFSNYGTCLDIFAPGQWIPSAWHATDTATNTLSGTSMACPHVAGVAALLMEEGINAGGIPAYLVADGIPGVVQNAGTGSPNVLLYAIPKDNHHIR